MPLLGAALSDSAQHAQCLGRCRAPLFLEQPAWELALVRLERSQRSRRITRAELLRRSREQRDLSG
jgi:hypothetical protein